MQRLFNELVRWESRLTLRDYDDIRCHAGFCLCDGELRLKAWAFNAMAVRENNKEVNIAPSRRNTPGSGAEEPHLPCRQSLPNRLGANLDLPLGERWRVHVTHTLPIS